MLFNIYSIYYFRTVSTSNEMLQTKQKKKHQGRRQEEKQKKKWSERNTRTVCRDLIDWLPIVCVKMYFLDDRWSMTCSCNGYYVGMANQTQVQYMNFILVHKIDDQWHAVVWGARRD